MENQEKTELTYTKEMLIKNIAEACCKDLKTVRSVYNALEKNIARLLSYANSDTDITIRLFEGITLGSTYIPERTKINNLTGKEIVAASKIKPKANITRSYRDKITDYNK